MARVLLTRRWLLIELAHARSWLLVELARAKVVWPDIKTSLEFKIALLLFVIFTVGVAVLGLIVRR
jgi:hypothetical protein